MTSWPRPLNWTDNDNIIQSGAWISVLVSITVILQKKEGKKKKSRGAVTQAWVVSLTNCLFIFQNCRCLKFLFSINHCNGWNLPGNCCWAVPAAGSGLLQWRYNGAGAAGVSACGCEYLAFYWVTWLRRGLLQGWAFGGRTALKGDEEEAGCEAQTLPWPFCAGAFMNSVFVEEDLRFTSNRSPREVCNSTFLTFLGVFVCLIGRIWEAMQLLL